MKVADIMHQPIVTIPATASIVDAAAKMRDWNVGLLTVLDQDQLVGVITDRDVVVRVVANGETAPTALVREIMSDEVLICLDKQSIEDAAAIMCDFQVRRLPVFNSAERTWEKPLPSPQRALCS